MDVFIPALHGLHGEDGTIQGLLELADVPYTSAGVVGSAAGMDKYVMKCAFKGAGVPVVDGVLFLTGTNAEQDPSAVIERLEKWATPCSSSREPRQLHRHQQGGRPGKAALCGDGRRRL